MLFELYDELRRIGWLSREMKLPISTRSRSALSVKRSYAICLIGRETRLQSGKNLLTFADPVPPPDRRLISSVPYPLEIWVANGPVASVCGFPCPTRMAEIRCPAGASSSRRPLRFRPRSAMRSVHSARCATSSRPIGSITFLGEWKSAYPSSRRALLRAYDRNARTSPFAHSGPGASPSSASKPIELGTANRSRGQRPHYRSRVRPSASVRERFRKALARCNPCTPG